MTIEDIAKETRITARFLHAIDDENFADLPGGIFNRSFIRTYAGLVGLDPVEAVAEYRTLVDEPTLEQATLTPQLQHQRKEGHVFPIAVGSLVVMIVLFYVFASDSGTPSEAAISNTVDATVVAEPDALPVPIPVGLPRATGAPATSSPARPFTEAAQPVATEPVISETVVPESNAAHEGINVRIDVHDDTWVKIQSDGEEILQGVILSAGTIRNYSAAQALQLTIGNAAGLTLSINGRQLPTLGRDGQVRNLTITPDNAALITGS